ncbi:MAG: hypothetical protein F4Z52_09200, partial [Gammaproteobacteria bacterium]|nr:hypothetical protein [Gammaproteobacteria bacterium]
MFNGGDARAVFVQRAGAKILSVLAARFILFFASGRIGKISVLFFTAGRIGGLTVLLANDVDLDGEAHLRVQNDIRLEFTGVLE